MRDNQNRLRFGVLERDVRQHEQESLWVNFR